MVFADYQERRQLWITITILAQENEKVYCLCVEKAKEFAQLPLRSAELLQQSAGN